MTIVSTATASGATRAAVVTARSHPQQSRPNSGLSSCMTCRCLAQRLVQQCARHGISSAALHQARPQWAGPGPARGTAQTCRSHSGSAQQAPTLRASVQGQQQQLPLLPPRVLQVAVGADQHDSHERKQRRQQNALLLLGIIAGLV